MVGNPSEPLGNGWEPLGTPRKWSGTPRKWSGTPRNPSEMVGTSSEMVGTSSEMVGNPFGNGREPLRNLSEHLRKWSGTSRKWSEHLRKRVVFLPENPPNLSEPLRNPGRNILVKFEEEKGNVTLRARTRHLWRTNPTRSPLDYRVSHTARGEILLTSIATGIESNYKQT